MKKIIVSLLFLLLQSIYCQEKKVIKLFREMQFEMKNDKQVEDIEAFLESKKAKNYALVIDNAQFFEKFSAFFKSRCIINRKDILDAQNQENKTVKLAQELLRILLNINV